MNSKESENLRRIVDDLVVTQGNEFIKELLRKKKLRIGTNKADFESSLHDAISSGELTADDVKEWLGDVEGWGGHHAYLFRIDHDAANALFTNEDSLAVALRRSRLLTIRDKPRQFAFPQKLIPTSVTANHSSIEVAWHRGSDSWVSAPDKNYELTEEGDSYRFRAERKRSERRVVRLVARSDLDLAGIFISIPLEDEEQHVAALNEARKVARNLLADAVGDEVDVGVAQLRLDHPGPAADHTVTASRSRMRSQGAYVEFGASSATGNFNDVDDVREVRLAARNTLAGDLGEFNFVVGARDRTVKVRLVANENRIHIRAQITAEEEWEILHRIAGT